jgi:hypothetical protein
MLGLTVCKFSHGGWSWNLADGVDLLLEFLASWQFVSYLMVAGAVIKLMVMICSWHSWLDSK